MIYVTNVLRRRLELDQEAGHVEHLDVLGRRRRDLARGEPAATGQHHDADDRAASLVVSVVGS